MQYEDFELSIKFETTFFMNTQYGDSSQSNRPLPNRVLHWSPG